ncbi:MAG: hypothetical protein DSY76_03365 [Bacteroidetes bacterium]|nr:MAG: hypothetical protein DSY76_03365 [Bacteroidota bacterium]
MSSKNLIQQLIWKNQKKGVLLFASIGMFIGMFILFISIQLYFDIINISKSDKEIFNKDYIVINKKISILNTVKFLSTGFSQNEIDSIKKQDFVEKIGIITPNKFKVGAYTDGTKDFPEFYAEMFFESVPDEFMDINADEWHWDKNSAYIPIVIPRDYLKLYNFGFAQSQNLPQISEEIASKAMADFMIEGRGKKIKMKGKIVGFTDRINSILVPQSFMEWANETLGRKTGSNKPSRIIIVSNDPASPRLAQFLKDNNYEANLQQTKGSRLNTLLQILLSIVLLIGTIIVLLAFIIFVVSFKLMISKAHNSIEKLLIIGYHYTTPAKIYISIYGILITIIYALSIAAVYISKEVLANLFTKIGFAMSEGLSFNLIIISIAIGLILFISNSISIIFQFRKLASK